MSVPGKRPRTAKGSRRGGPSNPCTSPSQRGWQQTPPSRRQHSGTFLGCSGLPSFPRPPHRISPPPTSHLKQVILIQLILRLTNMLSSFERFGIVKLKRYLIPSEDAFHASPLSSVNIWEQPKNRAAPNRNQRREGRKSYVRYLFHPGHRFPQSRKPRKVVFTSNFRSSDKINGFSTLYNSFYCP